MYGLKTFNTPPAVKELISFENDLFDLAKNIEFRKVHSDFQNELSEDIRKINDSEKAIIPADKTSNHYKVTKDQYNKMKKDSITATYKTTSNKIKNKINVEGKKAIEKYDKQILNKMEINSESSCFITLKDHKDNFENNPTVRLINPAKNEVGRISKHVLDRINTNLKNILQLNQWKNTKDVIDWFEKIESKSKYKFLVFDIKHFYPSIKQKLLTDALTFARQHLHLTENEISIINHTRKSLLFNGDETWIKKESNLFDVTMGAFDGAEICELVGTIFCRCFFIFSDSGPLTFLKTAKPSSRWRPMFSLLYIFVISCSINVHGLQITIQCNMKIVNYLDITLNLNDRSFRPYHKADNQTNYIHNESNHLPNILKQIPINIEKRLSTLSKNETIFNESKPYFQEGYRNLDSIIT